MNHHSREQCLNEPVIFAYLSKFLVFTAVWMRYTIHSSGCTLEDKIIDLSRNVGKRKPDYAAAPVSVVVEFSRPLMLHVYTVRFRILQQHFLNSLASSLEFLMCV